ncbi:MAG: HAD family hydrolase [Gammaproteobacteria bacterium]
MRAFPRFAAVILDMDGLVLDTESTYRAAWARAALDFGHHLTEEFLLSLVGLHYEEVEARLVGVCGGNLQLERFREISAHYWRNHVRENGLEVMPGFHRLLAAIRSLNLPYCLATNSLRRNAEECLDIAAVRHFFPLIVTRDQVERAKPSPDVFFKAAEMMNISVSQCLVVEDSSVGIEAALRAGAIPVMVSRAAVAEKGAGQSACGRMKDLDELADAIFSRFSTSAR